MRVLLDTNVLVRATGESTGPARALLLRLAVPPHVIVTSAFLLTELRRVLTYPRVLRIHGLTDTALQQYVEDVAACAELVDVPTSIARHVLHDPDDDPVVACAVYGRADVLCTLDRHLSCRDVRAYCAQFKIRVLTDAELVDELRAVDSHSSQ